MKMSDKQVARLIEVIEENPGEPGQVNYNPEQGPSVLTFAHGAGYTEIGREGHGAEEGSSYYTSLWQRLAGI